MRLGQLAKKYDIPVKDIISYLEEHTGEKFHPNAKLYDTIEAKIFDHFELIPATDPEPVAEEPVAEPEPLEADVEPSIETKEEAPKLPATPEEEIAMLDGDLASPEELQVQKEEAKANEIKAEEPAEEVVPPAEDEIIQTDKLLEMLESEEPPADLDKIKLIKAPKKELSGLKVVGKVDLPEPKKKEEKVKEVITEKDLREYRNPRKRRQPLSEEEKEKRRLKAKRKKEAYEERQEKRRKEQEGQKQKARKEAHYKQKLAQAKAAEVKRKTKQQAPPAPNQEAKRPEPKTKLGKFWRWMNT